MDAAESMNGYRGRRLAVACVALLLVASCGERSGTEAERLTQGIDYREAGELRASVIALKNLLRENPESREARWQLGLTYLEMGQGAEAENEFVHAQALGLTAERATVALARARLLQGRHEEALRVLEGLPPGNDTALAQAHVIRGLAHLDGGRHGTAAAAFHAALEVSPEQVEAVVGLARLRMAEGDLDAARARVDEALVMAPRYPDALRSRGDIARAAQEWAEAERAYSQALAHAPEHYATHLRRALVRIQQADRAGAEADLETMERLAPDHPMTLQTRALLHLRAGRWAAAQADLDAVVGRLPDHLPARYLLATAHYALGHWQQVESHLKYVLRSAPDSPGAVLLLAQAWLQQERVDDAVKLLERGIESADRPTPQLSRLLGALYLDRGATEAGVSTLRNALYLQPDLPDLQELLGVALLRSGDREGGLTALRRASSEDSAPRRADGMVIRNHLQAQEFTAALAAAERYLEKQPDSAEAHNLRGAALLGLERIDEARAAFHEALRRESGTSSSAMNLAGLELRLGNRKEARRLYAAVQSREPGHLRSAWRLATMELEAGRPEEARRWLRDVVEAHPEAVEPALLLARVQRATGADEAALRTLSTVVERHPERLAAYYALAESLQAAGRPGDALALLQRAERTVPDSAELQRRQALAQRQAGDAQAALATLRRAVEAEPDHTAARAQLAFALAGAGAVTEARNHLRILREGQGEAAVVQALAAWLAGLEEARQGPAAEAEQQIRAGRLLLALGDPQGAAVAFGRALEAVPGAPEAGHQLALLDLRQGADAAARSRYLQILEVHPEHLESLVRLAALALRSGEEAAAQARLAQGIAAHPEALEPRMMLARHHLAAGRPLDALAVLQPVQEARDERLPYLRLLGASQLAAGRLREAAATFRRQMALQPQAVEPRYLLAAVATDVGRSEEALALLEPLERLASAHPLRDLARARGGILRQEWEGTEALLERLRRQQPENAEVHALSGLLAARSGATGAAEHYRKALQQAARSPWVIALSAARWRAGERKEAIEALERWLERQPADHAVRLQLAESYRALGEEVSAVAAYRRVLEAEPENWVVMNNLAWLLREREPEEAARWAAAAVERAPDVPEVLETRGTILLAQGRNSEALELLREAVRQGGGDRAIRFRYARALAETGHHREARETLDAILKDGEPFTGEAEARALRARL